MLARCSICVQDLPLSAFHRGRSKHGVHTYCKTCSSKIRRQRYLKTKDRHRELNKQWIADNYNRNRAYQNEYFRAQKFNNPVAYLARRLRDRIRTAVKQNQKSGSAVEDLGCSIDEFKLYIENQFDEDMTWDNYGKVWEMDHVIPLSHFDLTNRMEFLEACNWLNIQPVSINENRSKGGRYVGIKITA